MTPAEAIDQAELIELQQRLRLAAYRQGWADGARGQYERGRADAIADVKRTWHEVVSAVHLTGERRALAGQRRAPGGEVWLAAVARNGLTEYGGDGRPRVPVPPEVIAQSCREQKGRAA